MESNVGLSVIAYILSLPALAVNGYLGFLGCLARQTPSKPTQPRLAAPRPHITFVVPAHNETHGIVRTLESLKNSDYPEDRFSVLVVADNCSDDTKERALAAGARVLERHNMIRRGKGYALEFAFETLLSEGLSDGLVVVDADTDVSSNLLNAVALRLQEGAAAMQAHYGVRNASDSWRTRLMDVAFTLYHGVRSTARERLSLSSGLRGNGMAFSIDTLRLVPYRSYSLVEDVEYGIELGLNGIRVVYIGEAEVRGEMVASKEASESQRLRWEQGRSAMVRRYVPQLLVKALREKNAMLLDLAFDLLTPPLTVVVLYTTLGTGLAIGTVCLGWTGSVVLIPWLVAMAGLAIYLAKGMQMSPQGIRTAYDLIHVPKYALWKVGLAFRRWKRPTESWVRTSRKDEIP
jgi:cellulose synthase/poly-beta-1,6-N-acetylglucosamine synthase-like glycosyltransferase